jgi:hypothetical protein
VKKIVSCVDEWKKLEREKKESPNKQDKQKGRKMRRRKEEKGNDLPVLRWHASLCDGL